MRWSAMRKVGRKAWVFVGPKPPSNLKLDPGFLRYDRPGGQAVSEDQDRGGDGYAAV